MFLRANNTHISFVKYKGSNNNQFCFNSSDSTKDTSPQSITLLSNLKFIKFLPRNFTITTNNGSSKFNIEFIKDTSSVISQFLSSDPQNLQFHLDISDEMDVLNKFERMYQGEVVVFTDDELKISKIITQELNIINCPNFMKPSFMFTPESNFFVNDSIDNNQAVEISKTSLSYFFTKPEFKTFTIITDKNRYECSIFGIYSSTILRKMLQKDPKINQYVYNFADENEDFQFICNFFNFKTVDINKNNMDSIKEIAEDFQITCILDIVNKYINDYEELTPIIDEQQKTIDTIENLFDLLYNIKTYTVVNVKSRILDSSWVKSEDNVRELAAFIIKVAMNSIQSQKYLFELVIELEKEGNYLNVLVPVICNRIMKRAFDRNDPLSTSFASFGFIYKFFKKGIIKKEEIFAYFKNYSLENNYLNAWFLPELIEENPNKKQLLLQICNVKNEQKSDFNSFNIDFSFNKNQLLNSFIAFYLPDRMDLYEKMRDSGEPDDEITIALRNDDVDKFQSIISQRNKDISSSNVPFNIYENFVQNGQTNYINYAAAYGSIRCFKFLLLNHAKVDDSTFKYAVYGGNIEIVKIVDNSTQNNNNEDKFRNDNLITFNFFTNRIEKKSDKIIPSIVMHRNALFDWIFENKLNNDFQNRDSLYDFVLCSIQNGNAYSLVQLIEKGFDFQFKNNQNQNLVDIATKNGFYLLTKMLLNIMNQKTDCVTCETQYMICFDNISILKLFEDTLNEISFNDILRISVEDNLTCTLKYIFNLSEKKFNKFLTEKNITIALSKSVFKKTNEIFFFLYDQIQKRKIRLQDANQLLTDSLSTRNNEASKAIINLILESDEYSDFANFYIDAAAANSSEICQYLIDKKVTMKFDNMFAHSLIGKISKENFIFVTKNVDYETKNKFMSCIQQAISQRNADLAEYLLQNNAPYISALFTAISTNDIKMVDLVLKYHNKPSFINRITNNGTALTYAVSSNKIEIAKRLLSLPGINLSLYSQNKRTPLILSALGMHFDMFNSILEMYGDDIRFHQDQINFIAQIILERPTKEDQFVEMNEQFLDRILDIKSINHNFCYKHNSLLTYACKNKLTKLIEKILQNDQIDVNLYDSETGNSPLIIAVESKQTDIAKILIECPRTNINWKNFANISALVYAAQTNQSEIVDLIIKSERFDPEESYLNFAFLVSSDKISKRLISLESLDVNDETIIQSTQTTNNFSSINIQKLFRTPLMNAVYQGDQELVELIIAHNSFDKDKSQLKEAILILFKNQNFVLFQKLLDLLNDANIVDCKGNNLIDVAIENLNKDSLEMISYILNHKSFDPHKNDIVHSFQTVLSKHFIASMLLNNNDFFLNHANNDNTLYENIQCDTMKIIYEYDKKHENLIDLKKLLPDGKSFFTSIQHPQNENVVNYLIENGADPNQPDANCVYPLEHAFHICSSQFVSALIKSKKVDYKVKIPYKDWYLIEPENPPKYVTYLHVACASRSLNALKLFVGEKVIDINVEDDAGETPLMAACRALEEKNVAFIRSLNEVKFLHENKSGQDALHILSPNIEISEEIMNNKAYYFNGLSALINDIKK